jgi:hypothetical protein
MPDHLLWGGVQTRSSSQKERHTSPILLLMLTSKASNVFEALNATNTIRPILGMNSNVLVDAVRETPHGNIENIYFLSLLILS